MPEPDATQEEEHIHTDIATTAQAEEHIRARQGDVEEDDEQNSRPHQFATITAHVGPCYLSDLHGFGEGIRSMICFTAQERAMATTT